MKLAILGATGFVGKVLVARAVQAGHPVQVLARSPEKLGDLAARVQVVQGNMFDPAALQKLVTGADAVISAAGPPLDGKHDSNQHANAMRLLVDAMQAAKVQRIITIAGAAAQIPGQSLGFKQSVLRVVLNFVRPDVIKTKDMEVEILTASTLNWTIIRPPLIRAGNPSRNLKARADDMPGMKVEVEDIADFILSNLSAQEWEHRAPIVAS